MKTKTLTYTSIAATALIALFAFSAMTAFAEEEKRPQFRAQVRDDVQELRKDFKENITDEQKKILEEVRELREADDQEGARALLDEAGIVPPRQEVRGEVREEKAGVRAAIKAGDYNAFLEATEDGPIDVQLTEDQFKGLSEIHELKESGDYEEARALAEKLDLPKLGKRAHKRFAKSLTDEQQETLKAAHELAQDGDKDAAKELLEGAGIEMPAKKPGLFKRIRGWFGNNS